MVTEPMPQPIRKGIHILADVVRGICNVTIANSLWKVYIMYH